jgi:Uma2 family endonuclease
MMVLPIAAALAARSVPLTEGATLAIASATCDVRRSRSPARGLNSCPDDGIVVVMDYERRRLTLEEYLSGEETNRPMELDFGVLREPAAPSWSHQLVVGRAFVRLDEHVSRHRLGRVVQSPVDVVLDRERGLVVQPDLVFVAADRLHICTDRVWGPPDLTVEVLSTGTARRDCTVKLSWFQHYGVRECWLIDPVGCEVTVVSLTESTRSSRVCTEDELVESNVFPQLDLRVADLFT